jgi:flagellar motor switch protein FliM
MIVIPYSTIEPIKQKLSSSFQTDIELVDTVWSSALHKHILRSDTSLSVNLGKTEISVGDLLNLEKGDIIPLNQDATGEINILVEGVEKIRSLIGTHKGNKAIQILDKISKGK